LGSTIETARLEFYVVEFRLLARERISFPAGKAGNVLRGAFGSLLRQQSCRPQCNGTVTCAFAAGCSYAAIFEPHARQPRFANPPRPFVFRANHLDGKTFQPGQDFAFQLNLFDPSRETLQSVLHAFSAIQQLGAARGKTELLTSRAAIQSLDLNPGQHPVQRIEVRFETPTELKSNNTVVETPEFPILYARALERVSALSPGAVEAQSCDGVQLTGCSLATSCVERRSSRTGQRHRIGGFTGSAIYEGDLRKCLPVLQAAEFTGVGRHTSWGNGRLLVTVLA
jgi:hypothetical protein